MILSMEITKITLIITSKIFANFYNYQSDGFLVQQIIISHAIRMPIPKLYLQPFKDGYIC